MSVNFNGNTYQISTTSTANGYPLTISAWIRKSSNVLRGIVSLYSTSDTSRCWLGMNVTGNALLGITTNAGASTNTAGTTVMASGVWNHIVCVFASSTSRILYLNGSQDGTSTTTRAITNLDSLIIGGLWTSGTSSNNRFTGDLAEVSIYNRVLTASDVSSLYNGGPKVLPASNLIFWDRMLDVNRKDIVGRTAYSFTSGTNTLITAHPRTF